MFIKDNAKLIVAFIIVGLIGGVFLYLLQSDEKTTKDNVVQQAENRSLPVKVVSTSVVTKKTQVNFTSVAEKNSTEKDELAYPVESITPETFSVPLNSLADARINGDPRTPPIARSAIEREMPTLEELADPDLYQEYETRQNQKVYRSFYSASKNKLVEMEKLMEQARSQGVSEDKLREGEEKIAKMKAMREKLAQTYDDISDE